MKAKGNTRIIIQKVGRIQDLLGQVSAAYANDVGGLHSRGDRINSAMQEAHELCVEITGMYDPLPWKKNG